jgi:hypothetical protein
MLAATAGRRARPLPCAIAGHSFGACTAQLLAGAEIDLPGRPAQRFVDPRFAAALLLSAQGRDHHRYSRPRRRRPGLALEKRAFHLALPGGKYLAIFEGADHYLGGIDRPNRKTADPAQFAAVAPLATPFLHAQLAGDAAALAWLEAVGDEIAGCPLRFERK